MAAQTITNISVNHDSSTVMGLLHGETYTINGGVLTIDADPRYSYNAAALGSLTISAVFGGKVVIDGTKGVWIYCTSNTGGPHTVPASLLYQNNTITGNLSGGVGIIAYAVEPNPNYGVVVTIPRTLCIPPSQPCASSGMTIFHLREYTGSFIIGETLTTHDGQEFTLIGAELAQFTVPMRNGTTVTVPRLGSFEVNGVWKVLGTIPDYTTLPEYVPGGIYRMTFPFLGQGTLTAIQVETAPNSNEWEWYMAMSENVIATPAMAPAVSPLFKLFNFNAVTNTIEFGVFPAGDGTQEVRAWMPPVGSRIRVPNVQLMNYTAGDQDRMSISSSVTGRARFSDACTGYISMDTCACDWYLKVIGSYSIYLKDVILLESTTLENVVDTITVENVAVGAFFNAAYTPFYIVNCRGGTYVKNLRVTNAILSSSLSAVRFTRVDDLVVDGLTSFTFGTATSALRTTTFIGITFEGISRGSLKDISTVTGYINVASCVDVNISDVYYIDNTLLMPYTSRGLTAIAFTTCINMNVDGIDIGFEGRFHPSANNALPYNGLISIVTNSDKINIINVGQRSSMGSSTSPHMGRICTASMSTNITLRRANVTWTRLDPMNLANTCFNVILENIYTLPYTGQAGFTASANNLIVKGCRWLSSRIATASTYGRVFQDSLGDPMSPSGNIVIYCNEPTTTSQNSVKVTIDTVSGGFTGTGNVYLPNQGDSVIWETLYYIKGHKYFCMDQELGTNLGAYGIGTSLYDFYFQIDINDGNGFTDWLPLMCGRVRNGLGGVGNTSIRVTDINVGNPNALQPEIGDVFLLGSTTLSTSYMTAGTTVTGMSPFSSTVTTIDISNPFITAASTSQVVYFYKVPYGVYDVSNGFKIKIKAVAMQPNTSSMYCIVLPTVTTESSLVDAIYPLPGIPITLTGLKPQTEVRVYVGTDPVTSVEIAGIESTQNNYTFEHSNVGQSGYIMIFAKGYQPIQLPITFEGSAISIPIQQVVDRTYKNL